MNLFYLVLIGDDLCNLDMRATVCSKAARYKAFFIG